MKIVAKWLAAPMTMAALLLLLAFASGLATFIENDFGSQAAKTMVYNAWWFELIFVLLAVNLVLAIFQHKLYRVSKLPVFVFHVAFVVIIAGAAITRYFSVEGSMHIREGETANSFQSSDKWLTIRNDSNTVFSSKVDFSVLNRSSFNETVNIGNQKIKVTLLGFIPHATQKIVDDIKGKPMVKIMVFDSLGGKQINLQKGESIRVKNLAIGFSNEIRSDFLMFEKDSNVFAQSVLPVLQSVMGANVESTLPANIPFQLQRQTVYSVNGVRFAFSGYSKFARIIWAYNPNPEVDGSDVLLFKVENSSSPKTIENTIDVFVPLTDDDKVISSTEIGSIGLGFNYSNPKVCLPFGIKLNNFVLERYPGSKSPSSFTSNVTVIDSSQSKEMPFSIFMNNILNYNGYRFYQSSYDPDEKGTFLSVNSDSLGTGVTYFGYFLMILGMLLALILPGSRFRQLISRKVVPIVVLFLIAIPISIFGQKGNVEITNIDKSHANSFGELVVQDKGGRIKPLSTLAGETLRKLNRANSFNGLMPEQVLLGMSAFPDLWQDIEVIKIRNEELKKLLGINGELAAFTNFFDYEKGGAYKLNAFVQEAFSSSPSKRNAFEKEVIKADERLNILYQIFSGQMVQLFPLQNSSEKRWLTMSEAVNITDTTLNAATAGVYAKYLAEVRIASRSGNWNEASKLLHEVSNYQTTNGGNVLPFSSKLKSEVFINRTLINERLIPLYGLLGLTLLILALLKLYGKNGKWISYASTTILVLLAIGFAMHTLGIGLRWYVAGRAPLSNGFETMIYIAWTAMLAGLLFHRKNNVVLPATALLATVTLFVAHLSWMDPEITNLVPVLKSYWLTIHVAVVTASYGFLGMGTILATFNLMLMAVAHKRNRINITSQVKETTVVIEIVLIVGLYLLTIGSFLGAIWANESWGRYWGWDPKETWAFITILVYTFIIHMRQMPALNSPFVFNFAATLGISSVLMTYFGVNYYLAGLHSYAGGESLPFPKWIFIALVAFFALSIVAWYRNRKDEVATK
jgi:cytochrome c-type biogenesis protein CcsB